MNSLDLALRLAVAEAAESYQDDPSAHAPPPTPSTVMHCLLQQWLTFKGYPRINRNNAASEKRLYAGHAVEDFWRGAFERLGFAVEPLSIYEFERDLEPTEMDAILYPVTPHACRLVELEEREPVVLELKDLGVWGYLDFVDKGAALGARNYYIQTQLKMEAARAQRGILLAGMADPSAVKYIWSRIKKREGRPPALWLEVLYPDHEVLREAHERAQVLNFFKAQDEIPWQLQEYNPDALLPREGFPCYYCAFANCNSLRSVKHD